MIENLTIDGINYAIIISHRFKEKGLHFFTPDDYSQQLAYMSHPTGHEIQPHIHNEIHRDVKMTQEVLVVRSGKIRVDFYDYDQKHVASRLLEEGDVILLAEGGHGFEIIEDVEVIEIKQGPYAGDKDKTRFNKPNDINVNLK